MPSVLALDFSIVGEKVRFMQVKVKYAYIPESMRVICRSSASKLPKFINFGMTNGSV
jgi:hypothetical protein